MDNSLFNRSLKLSEDVKRNICFTSNPLDAFAELIDKKDNVEIAGQAINQARLSVSHEDQLEDFYYTAAIEYPFATEPYMSSRYTTGVYPVWYGSRSVETTIYETVHNTIKYLSAVEGALSEERIFIKRSIYDVFCQAILINLVGRQKEYPELISEDYTFTQKIGNEIKQGGYPGILSPSSQHKNGENVNIFKKEVLSRPRLSYEVKYELIPSKKRVLVSGLKKELTIDY